MKRACIVSLSAALVAAVLPSFARAESQDDCQSENEVVVFHAGEAMAGVNFEQAESRRRDQRGEGDQRSLCWCSIFFRLVVIVLA